MIQAPSKRGRARTVTFAVAFVTALGVVAACSLSPRANGESCIKNVDCLSGVCSAALCVAAPELLDAEVNGDGGLHDGTTGEGGSGDSGTVSEAAPPGDTGSAGDDSGAAEAGATDSGSADTATE